MATITSPTHPQEPDEAVSAIGHIPSHLRFWSVASTILWLDLWSKARVFSDLNVDEIRPVLAPLFEFRRSLNAGAVFGSFSGHVGVFIAASIFALGFVFYLFARSSFCHRGLHVALALILAGALGNLYDRTFMQADVVTYQDNSGRKITIVGKVLENAANDDIKVGSWPEGDRPQHIARHSAEVRSQGVVRDFIKFVPRFPAWVPRLGGRDVWPWIFNIADAALVCGVGLLLMSSWSDRHKPSST